MKKLLESLLGPGRPLPRWFIALAAVVLVALFIWFWQAAQWNGANINREVTYNDQKVYMNMGSALKDSHYQYFVPRMRMPLYGVYLSFFYQTGATLEEFFPVARTANIALAIACVIILACVLRCWLGWGLGIMVALISGFTWYVEKAGYVQPEALLVLLIGMGCALLAELLRKPTWWKAIIAGVIIAGWHMTKASGPAILGIFFIAWTLKMIWPGATSRKSLALSAALLVASFLAPISPYLITSAKVFGSPFYNTQSKFYLWCEDVHEKHAIQRMEIVIRKPTPEELAMLPSAKKYLATHTWRDIRRRVDKGYEYMLRGAHEQHTELYFATQLCACLLLLSIGLYPRKAWAVAKEHIWEIAFVFGVLTAFSLVFAWMQPIRVGARLITSLHLVPLFFCLYWMREIIRGEIWNFRGMTLSVEKSIVGLILVPVWLILALSVLMFQMPGHYFGG